MKSKKLWVGIPLIVLVFGVLLAGCDLTEEDDELVAQWYSSQTAATNSDPEGLAFEFTSGGTLKKGSKTYDYEVNQDKNKITFKNGGTMVGETTFSISGTVLTINSSTQAITAGKYYKAGSSYSDDNNSGGNNNGGNTGGDALTVTSGGDDYSSGTLRYAVSNANNGDTITVSNSVTTITLTGCIIIDRNITIAGNSVVIVRSASWADTNGSFLQVEPNRTVSINRVHFKSGRELTVGMGLGGAIYNRGSLTVESCIFDDNQAIYGGAIYGATGSTATIVKGCTFYMNSATTSGGAIVLNAGALTLTGNLFYKNTAPNSNATSYPIVYKPSTSATVTSGGYNVVDIAYGTGAAQSGFASVSTDRTLSALNVPNLPFSVTTFEPLEALSTVMPSTAISGFPTTDFNGETRTWPGAPGAVNY